MGIPIMIRLVILNQGPESYVKLTSTMELQSSYWNGPLGPLLLTWFNFNLSMDK